MNALTDRWNLVKNSVEFGFSFEHFIFNEIKAYLKYTDDDRNMRFWRSKNQQEVDFIVGDNLAVEVKSKTQIQKKDLKGLKALCEEKSFRYKIVVSLERTPRLTDENDSYSSLQKISQKIMEQRFYLTRFQTLYFKNCRKTL